MRSNAAYDPAKATVYHRTIDASSGEAVESDVSLFNIYVRFPSASKQGFEKDVLGVTQATGIIRVRTPRNSNTKQIRSDHKLIHRGTRYEIISIPSLSLETDEIELECKIIT